MINKVFFTVFFLGLSFPVLSQVKIGGSSPTPNATAVLELESTSKGLLPPRLTLAERDAISAPATGLIIFNTSTNCLQVQMGSSSSPNWKCMGSEGCSSSTLTVTHTAGAVAPVTKTVTYQLVTTDYSGATKCWIAQNLGADHPATSSWDATEASAGWFWQFNLPQGYKHDGTTRTPNTTWISYISQNSDWTAANDPCGLLLGTGWRMPTVSELGTVGTKFTNLSTAYNGLLKLHAGGALTNTNGSWIMAGFAGVIWMASQQTLEYSSTLYIDNFAIGTGNGNKAGALPVRCLKD